MPASLFPPLKFKGTDANGKALAGGKLYTYLTGTNTPLPTYVDANKTTLNTNPVILDAAGEAFVLLDYLYAYRLELRDADNVQIYVVDNVMGDRAGSIAGPEGPQGPQGDMPAHQWSTTQLRFQNPDGSWGAFTELAGTDVNAIHHNGDAKGAALVVGTNDNQALVFETNNSARAGIHATGDMYALAKLAVGLTTALAPLHVKSTPVNDETVPGFLFEYDGVVGKTHLRHFYPNICYLSQNLKRAASGSWSLDNSADAGAALCLNANSGVGGQGFQFYAEAPGFSGTPSAKLFLGTDGRLGVGTITPTQIADINGNARIRGHVYDSSNSSGSTDQVLVRGASGIVWGSALKSLPQIVNGVLGAGYSGTYSSCASNQNTGTYIDLPVGKWLVKLTVLVTANLNAGEAIWGRINMVPGTGCTAIGANMVGLSKTSQQYYSIANGEVVIDNTSAATQRCYVYIGGCDYSVDRNWSSLMGSSWGENAIRAFPVA